MGWESDQGRSIIHLNSISSRSSCSSNSISKSNSCSSSRLTVATAVVVVVVVVVVKAPREGGVKSHATHPNIRLPGDGPESRMQHNTPLSVGFESGSAPFVAIAYSAFSRCGSYT